MRDSGPGSQPVHSFHAIPEQAHLQSSVVASDPICRHPGCTDAPARNSRYCGDHKQHKWDVWRWRQKKYQLTDPGLPIGHRRCRTCRKQFRFRSPNHRYCDPCRTAPKYRTYKYAPEGVSTPDFLATIKRHGISLATYRDRVVYHGWDRTRAMTTAPNLRPEKPKPASVYVLANTWLTKCAVKASPCV